MGIVNALIEFLVKHDLVPSRVRWRTSASGVGRLFNDVFHMLDDDKKRKLREILYTWGVNDADDIVRTLGIRRGVHGCAIALLAINSLFGIRSHIATEGGDEVVIRATDCFWKDMKNWTPEVCASIEQYDVGLVKGINENVSYYCTKRRSKGDGVCEVILKEVA